MKKDSIDRFFEQWAAQGLELPHGSRDFQYIYRIARISKILGSRLDATCAKHGLTRSQFEALAALKRLHPQPLCAQDLMDASLLTSGSVTAMINQLLKRELVERDQHQGDRRRIQIRLTKKGRKVVEAAIQERLEDNSMLANLLPEPERARLNRLMRRLLVAMEALDPESRP